MDLFVQHDRTDLEWDLRAGRITQAEYDEKMQSAGYYFVIAGMHRQFEAVMFFLALTKAGYPVSISGADAMLARFEADDCIGIVPHDHPTRYCARSVNVSGKPRVRLAASDAVRERTHSFCTVRIRMT